MAGLERARTYVAFDYIVGVLGDVSRQAEIANLRNSSLS